MWCYKYNCTTLEHVFQGSKLRNRLSFAKPFMVSTCTYIHHIEPPYKVQLLMPCLCLVIYQKQRKMNGKHWQLSPYKGTTSWACRSQSYFFVISIEDNKNKVQSDKKSDFMHISSTVLPNVDRKSEIFIWSSWQEPDWGPPNNMRWSFIIVLRTCFECCF